MAVFSSGFNLTGLFNATTFNAVNITFDPAKDASNIAKHGVSLGEAEFIEWDDAMMWPDQRRDYGEPRMVALAPIGQRLHCVVR